MSNEHIRTTVTFPIELYETLKERKRETGVDVSNQVRQAVASELGEY